MIANGSVKTLAVEGEAARRRHAIGSRPRPREFVERRLPSDTGCDTGLRTGDDVALGLGHRECDDFHLGDRSYQGPDRLDAFEFQSGMNLLKVNASEMAIATVMSALQATGLSGYRNDSTCAIGWLSASCGVSPSWSSCLNRVTIKRV